MTGISYVTDLLLKKFTEGLM